MKRLLLSFFSIFFFSILNAVEIDLNDPYYKLGWKNLQNSKSTTIKIPDAKASIEIIESEIYLDEKKNIKRHSDFKTGQDINIEDINESLIISDREGYYKLYIEYKDDGYVTTDRYKNFTKSDLIETLNKRKPDSVSKISWVLKPNLTENKISSYGYRVNWSDGDVSYEYESLVFGRNGYVKLYFNLTGDGNESDEFLNYYSNIIKEISSTVIFDDEYAYSDFKPEDYTSRYTLTNLIDGSYGMGISTDPTNSIAYCLITTSSLKDARIGEEDYPRFAGKVLEFMISDVSKEILDVSDNDEVNVLSGMYGPTDRQKFEKTDVWSNAYSLAYTNVIEVKGDTEKDLIKYDYKNKLQFENGKPVRLFANIDQTGLSFNKWNLKLNCRDYDFTSDEKIAAKKSTSLNSLVGTPEYFEELSKKIEQFTVKKKSDGSSEIIFNSKYSIFIEEDFDTVLFFESPIIKGNKSAKIITYGGYKYFNGVYSRNDDLAKTFIQPATFKKDGDMESYMREGFEIKNFKWKFSLRDVDEIMESSNVNYTNNIEAYIASNTPFSVSTVNEGWWYAGTFKLVNNIEDFHEIYKKNKSTYCSILKEELVKNSKNQNIQYNYSDFIDFNKRNNINC
ncbi:DUF2167 domain-containing protein [Candidatus Pelagibacter sp.]|nr:DUF2167 domain-containing protein [Candidatus Pelagibacter sp.]